MELFDQDRAGGQDAVCFTAGPPGAYFGAGTVHAYLAADRPGPVVVTGISTGAVSAAVMYKAYRELAKVGSQASPGQVEAARWAWFREYLEQITYSPLDFVWEAIPNPIDFFAQSMPVEDGSCPEELKQSETEARIQRHRLVRLGLWLSGLRVTVGDLADLAVRYVRMKEGYALWGWQALALAYRLLRVGILLAWRTVTNPSWIWRLPVRRKGKTEQLLRPSPLFGYGIWGGALTWALLTVGLPLSLTWQGNYGEALASLALGLLTPSLLLYFAFHRFVPWCLKPMGLDRGLLHKYPLQRALAKLFDDTAIERPRKANVPTLLVVAAPVNRRLGGKVAGSNQQFWARTNSGMRVDHALLTALSNPGLYAPEVYGSGEGEGPIGHWVSSTKGDAVDRLEMVDGSVIRTNPIPALFVWLRGMWDENQHGSRHQVERLFTEAARPGRSLHIVYGVPVTPLAVALDQAPETINIVQNGFASLALERRRDTELESKQTEFMSKFEAHIRSRERTKVEFPMFPILPNSIAPVKEISFANNLKPDRETALRYVAEGCRRTLETLYGERLAKAGGRLGCHELLGAIAKKREGFISQATPGLSEVCGACERALQGAVRESDPPGAYGLSDLGQLPAAFPNLVGDRPQPRIVFLASGGVFRGSFHVGVLAALAVARVKPDLVVGASVGAIAGAALAAQTALDDAALARDHNHRMVRVFLEVDRRVALTKSLKNVTKLLGLRGRSTGVSPALIQNLVTQGSRLDPAYAIVGAPPLLIDAISNLFLLPHAITRRVAAQFVAGHITEAMNLFWAGVQKETLRQLEIDDCIMGSDLLEETARRLLFPKQLQLSPNPVQPYLPHTAFFATATNVSRRMPVILGRDLSSATSSYNFLESCLASSAFPVVFTPRSESDLIPGGGSTRTLFSDGGIFDNLPFFPAIRVLSEVQEAAGEVSNPQQAYRDLQRRFDNPALIIAAALDSDFQGAEPDSNTYALWQAASRLRANVKLFSFCQSAELVYKQIGRYLRAFADQPVAVDAKFVNRIVPNCVLPILPTDPEHLNGTFAFSRSTGLRRERVVRSIADGCFRTLLELSDTPAGARLESLQVTMDRARATGRIAQVARLTELRVQANRCPFFEVDGQAIDCHFTQGEAPLPEVHRCCGADALHRQPVLA